MRVRPTMIILFLLALLAPTGAAVAAPAAGTPRWFPETGHTLAYNFEIFWEQNGGLPIFGYPLSEAFAEDGRLVQYFERARLEWHGEVAQVLAGHLGRWAAAPATGNAAFTPIAAPTPASHDYVGETGHTLIGRFRKFWLTHGGLGIFGFPLSQEFAEVNPQDGQTYIVQYFERARFEWHPALPYGQQIQLGQLGRQYLEQVHPAPEWALAPVNTPEGAWEAVRPTHIRIPQIQLDSDIVEGSFSLRGWDIPRYTAVHYWPIAGVPGTRGNIVIAAHVGYRDTLFNHLPEAQLGDEIVLAVGQTERRYHITAIWTDTWIMAPTADETLTLITCIPLNSYDHRLIVRAVPTNSEA